MRAKSPEKDSRDSSLGGSCAHDNSDKASRGWWGARAPQCKGGIIMWTEAWAWNSNSFLSAFHHTGGFRDSCDAGVRGGGGGGGKQKKKGKCIQSDGTVNKRGGRSEDVWRLMNPWMRTLARHAQQKLWVSSTCDEEAAVSKCNKEGLFCFPPRRRHPLCFQQRKWVTGVCRVQVSVRSKLWPHGHQNPGPVPLTSSVSFSVYLYPNLHTSVPRLVDLVLRSRYRFAVNARR